MDDLLDMIAVDDSASQISDKVKELLFSKAEERIDSFKPAIADILFNGEDE